MKRNSWFIVKYVEAVDLGQSDWLPAMGKRFRRAIQHAFDAGTMLQTEMTVNVTMTTKRTYWREDWEKTDPIEGESVWTDYRREAVKFQKKADAEDFAFQRTRDFPPYIGVITVERLRWNPTAKGPCGPVVAMASYSLAT
jgi:hypothetical protein